MRFAIGKVKKVAGVCAVCISLVGGMAFAEVGKSGWTIFQKAQTTEFGGAAAVDTENAGVSGALYNPALLGAGKQRELSFVSESGLTDDKFGGLMYGQPMKQGMIAGGVVYYDAGKLDLNWIEGSDLKTESVSAQRDIMGFVSYGRQYARNLYLGGTIKAARSDLAERNSALALAFDAGAVYLPSKNIPLSFAVQNVGVATKFDQKENLLPTTLYAGAGYYHKMKNSYVMPAVGISYNMVDEKAIPEVGAKLGYDMLSLNVGYRINADEGAWHLGVGFNWHNMEFGYAFIPSTYLNSVHRISVSYKFGTTGNTGSAAAAAPATKTSDTKPNKAAVKNESRIPKTTVIKKKTAVN